MLRKSSTTKWNCFYCSFTVNYLRFWTHVTWYRLLRVEEGPHPKTGMAMGPIPDRVTAEMARLKEPIRSLDTDSPEEDTLDTTATSWISVSLHAHAKRACALHVSLRLASVRACVCVGVRRRIKLMCVRCANIWSVTAWTAVGEPWHLFALINWVDPSAEVYILIALLLIQKSNGLSLWAFVFSTVHTFFSSFSLSPRSHSIPICGGSLM